MTDAERRDGFYWVLEHGADDWTIAEWNPATECHDAWVILCDERCYDSDYFAEIDERRIEREPPPPDEDDYSIPHPSMVGP